VCGIVSVRRGKSIGWRMNVLWWLRSWRWSLAWIRRIRIWVQKRPQVADLCLEQIHPVIAVLCRFLQSCFGDCADLAPAASTIKLTRLQWRIVISNAPTPLFLPLPIGV